MTSYEEMGPEGPRGWSPIAVAMIATLVLLLGLAGALFGIYVSDVNAKAAASDPTTQPQVIPTGPKVTPSTTPPVTPSSTPSTTPTSTPPPDSFALPKLAGLNFREARTTVRELKLGWLLKFEGAGNDATVRDSDPAAGAMVQTGVTVTIFVKGSAPLAVVPAIEGKQCAEAVNMIVDAGLYPDYKTNARTGPVLPAPPQVGLRWNDKMQLTCGG
jgi:PASTA domain